MGPKVPAPPNPPPDLIEIEEKGGYVRGVGGGRARKDFSSHYRFHDAAGRKRQSKLWEVLGI